MCDLNLNAESATRREKFDGQVINDGSHVRSSDRVTILFGKSFRDVKIKPRRMNDIQRMKGTNTEYFGVMIICAYMPGGETKTCKCNTRDDMGSPRIPPFMFRVHRFVPTPTANDDMPTWAGIEAAYGPKRTSLPT